MSKKIPSKLRPLYLELFDAAKAYMREVEHPVQDFRQKREMLDWLKECVAKIEGKE